MMTPKNVFRVAAALHGCYFASVLINFHNLHLICVIHRDEGSLGDDCELQHNLIIKG